MAQTQRWPMACRGQQAGRVAAAWAEHRPWPPMVGSEPQVATGPRCTPPRTSHQADAVRLCTVCKEAASGCVLPDVPSIA
eukprot:1469135-Lingulodinium_polyedra.AAC.1